MSTAGFPRSIWSSLNQFIGRFVTDLGAVHAGMVVIGEKLGLYKALAAGPMSSATRSQNRTDERYLCGWPRKPR